MGKTAIRAIHVLLAISLALLNWRFPLSASADIISANTFRQDRFESLGDIPRFANFQEETPADFEDVVQHAQEMRPILNELYAHLDRSQFDIDDLDVTLNYNAADIVGFVTQEIAFEQYSGVLRGELGTLIGRAGNAADQALLLRRLLDDAGYETRIARSTLSYDDALLLVNQMTAQRAEPPPAIDPAVLDDVLNQMAMLSDAPLQDSTGSSIVTPDEYYQAATDKDTQLILDALNTAGIQLGDDELMDNLIEEARDYFWVQYRLSAFEPWADAHPAFTDPASAPETTAVETIYRDVLPQNLHHRLRLEVFIEQKQTDTLVVHPLLTGWERTSAELIGKPITFTNRPNNLDLETLTDLETVLASANVFLPLVNGEIGAKAFDLDGNPFGIALVGPETIGATALIQSVAGELEAMTGVISDLGETPAADSDDLFTLTAQWIEYTLIAPDGRESKTRRYVMDRIGTANREQSNAILQDDYDVVEASKALLTDHTIMVIPTTYSDAYATERLFARALKEVELITHVASHPDLEPPPNHILKELIPLDDIFYETSLDFSSASDDKLVGYLPEPMLVIYQDGFVPGRAADPGFERVDVINNTRRVFQVGAGSIVPVPLETMRRGVWDTFAEQVLIRDTTSAAFNTVSALGEAATASIPLLVLTPNDPSRAFELAHSEQTRIDVQHDLEAGYIVIIPERSVVGSGETGWWRIDPITGETLGVTTGGYGQAYVEYIITVSKIVIPTLLSYYKCKSAGGSTGCCSVTSTGVGMAAMPAGVIVNITKNAAHALLLYYSGAAIGVIGSFQPVC